MDSPEAVFEEICAVLDNVVHKECLPSHRTPLLCISGPSGAGKRTLINKLKVSSTLPCVWPRSLPARLETPGGNRIARRNLEPLSMSTGSPLPEMAAFSAECRRSSRRWLASQ